MNDFLQPTGLKESPPQPLLPEPDRSDPPPAAPTERHGSRAWLLFLGVLVVVLGALAVGLWQHYEQHRQVVATAQRHADFVPTVHVEEVTQHDGRVHVTLPGTTLAFEQADIYARASGYVLKRYVDIGDHVKAGQLLAEISAPEVDYQVAQLQNSLQQAEATTRQNEANRSLAAVTWGRDSVLVNQGWVTKQQGDTDRFTLQAQQHATQAAQNGAEALQAQLRSTNQQKIYEQVVAPFDGIVTQRNIDVGSLIAANATSGTAMFSMVHDDVIRVWVYVPQDAAFGVRPGVDAVVRVPAMPKLTFHGKVTRVADALQPGTRTLLTEIDVPNPNRDLAAGVYCTVELKIPRPSPALIVPASAIIFNQNGMQVAVAENGVAHLRKIAIASDYGTEVELSDGVTAGDMLILQPPVDLADGDKVQVAPDPPHYPRADGARTAR
jgi:RND family efflux transporter MFP subunit